MDHKVKGSQSRKQIWAGTECVFHLCYLLVLYLTKIKDTSQSRARSEKLETAEVVFEAWANFGNVSHTRDPRLSAPLSMEWGFLYKP